MTLAADEPPPWKKEDHVKRFLRWQLDFYEEWVLPPLPTDDEMFREAVEFAERYNSFSELKLILWHASESELDTYATSKVIRLLIMKIDGKLETRPGRQRQTSTERLRNCKTYGAADDYRVYAHIAKGFYPKIPAEKRNELALKIAAEDSGISVDSLRNHVFKLGRNDRRRLPRLSSAA